MIWIIYNKKKKVIVNQGRSRPCGVNHRKSSIHAEQKAIEYCRKNYSRNYEIYIWRYNKAGQIKRKYSCYACTLLAQKYNFSNNIYTFYGSRRCSAIINNPPLSLCYQMN